MKLNEVLGERYDYPDMEDRGSPSLERLLNYIKAMTEHEKSGIAHELHDYIDAAYGNYHFWDDEDMKSAMQSFTWLKKFQNKPTDQVAAQVRIQLRKLEQDGVIADAELIRDKRGI